MVVTTINATQDLVPIGSKHWARNGARLKPAHKPIHKLPALPKSDNSALGSMYVYLISGALDVVPSVSTIAVSDTAMKLFSAGRLVRRYPRTNVYFASREPMSPPCFA